MGGPVGHSGRFSPPKNSLWIICFWAQKSQEVVKKKNRFHPREKHHFLILRMKHRITLLLSGQKRPSPPSSSSSSDITLTHTPQKSRRVGQSAYWPFSQSIQLIINCSLIPIRKPITFTTAELLADFMRLKHLRKTAKTERRSIS